MAKNTISIRVSPTEGKSEKEMDNYCMILQTRLGFLFPDADQIDVYSGTGDEISIYGKFPLTEKELLDTLQSEQDWTAEGRYGEWQERFTN